MQSIMTRRTAARLFFIIGFLSMALGYVFFQGSITNVSGVFLLISSLFIILGAGCAVIAIKLKKSSLYLFFAAYALQVGVFILLSSMEFIPVEYSRFWPILSIFAGIALIPAGWYRYGFVKIRYIVPALVFIALGSILLIFSLDVVSYSLAQFVTEWWPLLIVLLGLILMLVSLGTKKTEK